MLDKVIGGVTGFLKNYALGFVLAGAVANIILQLVRSGAVDVNGVVQVAVTALVAGITTSAVIGGVDSL